MKFGRNVYMWRKCINVEKPNDLHFLSICLQDSKTVPFENEHNPVALSAQIQLYIARKHTAKVTEQLCTTDRESSSVNWKFHIT
jgi:hypothetical protein